MKRFYHYFPDPIRRCQATIVISSCRPRLRWIVLICEKRLRIARSLLLRDRDACARGAGAYSGVRLLRARPCLPAHISILMTEQPAQSALTRNSLSSGVCKKSPESGPLLLTAVTRLMPLAAHLSGRELGSANALRNASKYILRQRTIQNRYFFFSNWNDVC